MTNIFYTKSNDFKSSWRFEANGHLVLKRYMTCNVKKKIVSIYLIIKRKIRMGLRKTKENKRLNTQFGREDRRKVSA